MATRWNCYQTAVAFNNLPLQDLKLALPALCLAIFTRCFETPGPDDEAVVEANGDVVPRPTTDPTLAAARFVPRFGEDVCVTTSSVLANAWAYLIALSLDRNQEHDNTVVPMLSIAQFNYCLGRTGMLGYWSDQNTGEYTYITLCGLIDKVHGEDWLGRVFVNYRDTQKIRLLTSAQSLPESLKIFLESPQLF